MSAFTFDNSTRGRVLKSRRCRATEVPIETRVLIRARVRTFVSCLSACDFNAIFAPNSVKCKLRHGTLFGKGFILN